MKYIIAGGRDFNNLAAMDKVLKSFNDITEIVCGDARGADTWGNIWASRNNISVVHFPANWNTFGKEAGFIRNTEMADYADGVIAFWDGQSRGTKHMIDIMKNRNKLCFVYDYDGNIREI